VRFRAGRDTRHQASHPNRGWSCFLYAIYFDERMIRMDSAFVPTTAEPESLSSGGDTVGLKALSGGM